MFRKLLKKVLGHKRYYSRYSSSDAYHGHYHQPPYYRHGSSSDHRYTNTYHNHQGHTYYQRKYKKYSSS